MHHILSPFRSQIYKWGVLVLSIKDAINVTFLAAMPPYLRKFTEISHSDSCFNCPRRVINEQYVWLEGGLMALMFFFINILYVVRWTTTCYIPSRNLKCILLL